MKKKKKDSKSFIGKYIKPKDIKKLKNVSKVINKELKNSLIFNAYKGAKRDIENLEKITKQGSDFVNSLENKPMFMEYQRPAELDILDELKDLNSEIGDKRKTVIRASYPLPEGAKWGKLTMRFVDGHTVKVSYEGLPTKSFDYKDMGFSDQKKNNPNIKWNFLRVLANNNGNLTNLNFDRRFNRNAKYEINETLKSFFNMTENPIPKYTKRDGYISLFRIIPEK